MAQLTLLDIAKKNGSDAIIGLIEENLNAAPEIRILPARTIKGTSYKTLIRKSFPTTGFRNANEGVATSTSQYDNKLVEAFIIDCQLRVDKAVADSSEDGAASVQALEASGVAQSLFQKIGSQVWYGTASDAKGFPGATSVVDSSMVVDATGNTTAASSSVWAIKTGTQFVQLVFGNATTLSLDPTWYVQQVLDASNNPYTAYVNGLTGHVGCQFVHKYALGRIKNLTAQSSKTNSDALISQLLAKFPVGIRPDYLFMGRRALQQLQASRTATTPTGAPAPIPQESFGIPIVVTDSLVDTEAIS